MIMQNINIVWYIIAQCLVVETCSITEDWCDLRNYWWGPQSVKENKKHKIYTLIDLITKMADKVFNI